MFTKKKPFFSGRLAASDNEIRMFGSSPTTRPPVEEIDPNKRQQGQHVQKSSSIIKYARKCTSAPMIAGNIAPI
jgi:hypothetical protein